ncbi:MAG: class I SAM-dependent RNA methyltransferase [Treponema sp.]|nr:class I SAM-dependent RNA methyltransferase [Treponema sp.]
MDLSSVIAEKMVFGGSCLAKIDNKNVFIPFAVPGEKLEIEITTRYRDYDEARVKALLESSPKRVQPACPLYQKCGGCNMMHIDYEYQVELKTRILEELMERAGVAVPRIQTVLGSPLSYRSRFQLRDGGMEGRGTNDLVPINECPVAVPEINEWLKNCPMQERPKGRGLLFGHKKAQPELSLALEREARGELKAYKKMSAKEKKKHGKKRPMGRFEGISQNEQRPVQIELCGKKIMFDAQGFFQSNIEVLEKAIPLVTQGLSGKNALDLYSGAGTFSVFLADVFENVVMVEHNRGALVFAEQNMAGKAHESYGISGADFVKKNVQSLVERIGNFDAVVVDPPRSGMEKEALDWLRSSGVPAIKYLSCNPSTQARDIKALADSGYKIADIRLLDFYPQTSHIESLLTCVLA